MAKYSIGISAMHAANLRKLLCDMENFDMYEYSRLLKTKKTHYH